jgi:hypothetical protein
MQKLPAVEELAVREMDIGEGHALEPDQLRHPRRHPPRHGRDRQPHRRRRLQTMRAPGGQAIDPVGQGQPQAGAADRALQAGDVLGRLLHQQQIGAVLLDQPDHVPKARAHTPQQIPADDPHRTSRLSAASVPQSCL